MDRPIDPAIEKRLRSLCSQVSVANKLDEELREELFGHMEDKLLAYLDGDQPVTADDAFILVREHFGDPTVVKGMLREVHAQEAGVGFARRVTAALALAIAVDIGMYLLFAAVFMGWISQTAGVPTATAPNASHYSSLNVLPPWTLSFAAVSWNDMGLGDALNTLLSHLALLAWPFIFWRVLRHWRRKAASGRPVWFQQWALWRMLLFVLLLWVLRDLLPGITSRAQMPGLWGGGASMLVPVRVSLLLHCVVWFWWTDQAPRRWVRLLCAMGMVYVVHVLRLATLLIPPSIALVYGDAPFSHEWTLHASLAFNDYVLSSAVPAFTSGLKFVVLCGLASLALYFGVLFLAKRNTPSPKQEA